MKFLIYDMEKNIKREVEYTIHVHIPTHIIHTCIKWGSQGAGGAVGGDTVLLQGQRRTLPGVRIQLSV